MKIARWQNGKKTVITLEEALVEMDAGSRKEVVVKNLRAGSTVYKYAGLESLVRPDNVAYEVENIENICPYKEYFCCEDCAGTSEQFFEENGEVCDAGEGFSEMATACTKCTKGIMNPTIYGHLVCDKCAETMPIKDVR